MPLGKLAAKLCSLDPSRKAEKLQPTNAQPIQIDLVPPETVPGRGRERVMVVMPSLAKR